MKSPNFSILITTKNRKVDLEYTLEKTEDAKKALRIEKTGPEAPLEKVKLSNASR